MSNDFSLVCPQCHKDVYSMNITHNLGQMAEAAGLYAPLWHPNDERNPEYPKYATAKAMIEIVEKGWKELSAHPEIYKQYNPENGWGSYDHFVDQVGDILQALQKYPDAKPEAWI